VVPDLEQTVDKIKETEREAPLIIATDAKPLQNALSMSYEKARTMIQEDKAVILLFGTAWGLHEEVMRKTDHILDPVSGKTGYNHLSVRTAAAIILDRLAGEI
jgi:tRNA (guanine37-N1)-methyltransferase